MKILEIAGETFAVQDRGTGSPLLLVHGFPLDHSMWDAQIETFSTSHRVIAPDLRGFGSSVVTDGTVTMRQHADDLVGVLDALGIDEPVVLCGLSMGGYVAWQFWLHHADRLRGLILCDTRAEADSDEVIRGRQIMAAQVLQQGMGFVPAAMLPKLVAPQTLEADPANVESLRRMILASAPAGVAASQHGMAARPDFSAQLANIALPSLLLAGTHDVISPPAEMRAIAAAMPDAQFVEIADAGHMAPMENPHETHRVIQEFLSELA